MTEHVFNRRYELTQFHAVILQARDSGDLGLTFKGARTRDAVSGAMRRAVHGDFCERLVAMRLGTSDVLELIVSFDLDKPAFTIRAPVEVPLDDLALAISLGN